MYVARQKKRLSTLDANPNTDVSKHTAQQTLLDMGLSDVTFLGLCSPSVPLPNTPKIVNDGIRLWRTFSWVTVGPLVLVEETMKFLDKLSISADHLYHCMVSVFPNGNDIFQQDSVPYQNAGLRYKCSKSIK
ncbi:hypothetical protein TNCV_1634051 [Trichonephila clavipes]|nr:hypothetical protein TNCV_1634051 [Trichonephila clavipes]